MAGKTPLTLVSLSLASRRWEWTSLVGLGLLFSSLGFVLGRYSAGSKTISSAALAAPKPEGSSRKSKPGTFWLAVELTFKSQADLDHFIVDFGPMAAYCRDKEAETLSYIMARSDKDPLKVIIFERYLNKDSYLVIHKSSTTFQEFRAKLSAFNPVIVGNSYLESEVGYL